MLDQPQLSIFMPVYNAASSLQMTLDSILAQDFPAWELLAIDDGSTDDSLHILQQYAADCSKIRVATIDHQGVVAASHRGIEMAQAPILARMDADDYAYPQRMGTQWRWLQDHPPTGVVSSLVDYGGDPQSQQGYAQHVAWLNSILTADDISFNRFVDAPVANPSVMFRKALIDQYGIYRAFDGPEDYELWLRWLEKGVKIEKVPEVLLRWYDPPTRLSRTHENYSVEAFERVKAPYLARWLKQHNRHRRLGLWGAGRKTRKRLAYLLETGVHIDFFIDFKKQESIHGVPVFSYLDHAIYEHSFILSYVNNRGAREEISAFLQKKGKKEGEDFLLT